jgi:hypothetical protein
MVCDIKCATMQEMYLPEPTFSWLNNRSSDEPSEVAQALPPRRSGAI